MAKIPRKLSLVRFTAKTLTGAGRTKYPFRAGRVYIFLGEIPNMRGHCVVAEQDSGKIYAGYHTENFAELAEDDT